jgi:hypothetical protein
MSQSLVAGASRWKAEWNWPLSLKSDTFNGPISPRLREDVRRKTVFEDTTMFGGVKGCCGPSC